MRRTIATMLILAGWATTSAALRADEVGSSTSEHSPVAQYHLGDADDSAPAKAEDAEANPASTSLAGTVKAAYDEATVSEPVALASAGLEIDAGPGMSCCQPCAPACCGNWFCNSVRLEYLAWWSRGRNLPPLVTTSPNGTPQGQAGVLGFGTTDVLYGDGDVGTNVRSGLRLSFSHQLADECTWLDARFWGVEDGSETYSNTSTLSDPILAIPFSAAFGFPVLVESSQLVSFPGVSQNGRVFVQSKNDLFGADVYLRRTMQQGCCSHIDVLGGYLFSRMDDSLYLQADYTTLTVPFAGNLINIQDSFRTQNEFHGAQIGFLAEGHRNCVSVELLGKIGIGNMNQRVEIAGSRSSTTPPNQPAPIAGGLFAQPSNIGTYERDRFAFVPEINTNVCYQINPCWKATLGYSFIYWSNVVLAGNQIDRRVDQGQQNPLPAFVFNRTDFWVQGLNLGVQYQW